MIIGGAEVYRLVLPRAERIYLTRVHAEVEGDVFFPELDPGQWTESQRVEHPRDEGHDFAYSFMTLSRSLRS